MPAKTIIEFILYILPGFLALELFHYIYPTKKKSDFHNIAWSIIWGALIYSLVKWLDNKFLINTYFSLYSHNNDVSLRLILALLIMGIIVGGIILLSHIIIQNIPFLNFKDHVWNKINDDKTKKWAVIYLDDNSIYRGWINEYSDNPDDDFQDFTLKDATRLNDEHKIMYIISDEVYINTKNVKRIEFYE